MRRLGGCITRPTALQMSTLYIFFKLFAPEHHLLECLYNHSNADVILCYYHQILFSCARFPLIPRQLRTSNSRISSVAKKNLVHTELHSLGHFPRTRIYFQKSHTPTSTRSNRRPTDTLNSFLCHFNGGGKGRSAPTKLWHIGPSELVGEVPF